MTVGGAPGGGLPLPPAGALAASGVQRQVTAMQRLTDEPVLAAVQVRAAGTRFWTSPMFLGVLLALQLLTSGSPKAAVPLGLVSLFAWMGVVKLFLARRTRPVRLGFGGVLAAGPMTIFLARANPLTGKAAHIDASWPRSSVSLDVSPRARLGVRRVTLGTAESSIRLEAVTARAAIREGLAEVARTPYTPPLPVPSWYADPLTPGGLRYWDGSRWTERTTQLWPYSAE